MLIDQFVDNHSRIACSSSVWLDAAQGCGFGGKSGLAGLLDDLGTGWLNREMSSRGPAVVLTVVALFGCAAPTRHWSPAETPRPEDWRSPGLLLLRYDANNDGVVTKRELEAGLRQDFWQADINRDGCLDADESRAYNMRSINNEKSTAIPLVDWNQSGCIDFNEFAAPMRSLLDEFDANEDGQVTLQEMHLRIARTPTLKP